MEQGKREKREQRDRRQEKETDRGEREKREERGRRSDGAHDQMDTRTERNWRLQVFVNYWSDWLQSRAKAFTHPVSSVPSIERVPTVDLPAQPTAGYMPSPLEGNIRRGGESPISQSTKAGSDAPPSQCRQKPPPPGGLEGENLYLEELAWAWTTLNKRVKKKQDSEPGSSLGAKKPSRLVKK